MKYVYKKPDLRGRALGNRAGRHTGQVSETKKYSPNMQHDNDHTK